MPDSTNHSTATLLDRYPESQQTAPRTDRADFVDFTLVDGQRKAFRWDQLVWFDLLAGKTVILNFASHAVRIDGSNLNILYEQLLERRVTQVTAGTAGSATGREFEVTNLNVWQKPTGERAWPVDALKALDRMIRSAGDASSETRGDPTRPV